ncbi:MAG TPA: hypothetical protein VGV14_10485, partial [Rhodanobacter sp.]|nr:hypothetical protein [Rhodanobacter sp.]
MSIGALLTQGGKIVCRGCVRLRVCNGDYRALAIRHGFAIFSIAVDLEADLAVRLRQQRDVQVESVRTDRDRSHPGDVFQLQLAIFVDRRTGRAMRHFQLRNARQDSNAPRHMIGEKEFFATEMRTE